MPSIDRAAEICEALDLEFYVGPAREGGGRRGVFAESFEARTLRGGEVEVDGERVRGLAWFSPSWLDRNNRRPTSRRAPPCIRSRARTCMRATIPGAMRV